MTPPAHSEAVDAGFAALERGDWNAAREAFEQALAMEQLPDALDGLGRAKWWLNELAAALDLRSRAYAGYVEAGRHADAVQVAAWLAREYFTVHGNLPAAGGWISRADTQLEKAGPCVQGGWLALIKSGMTTDAEAMKGLAADAIQLGRRFVDSDLEIVGLSALGLAHVYACEIGAGMRHLDEAMAAASGGELRTFEALSDVYCNTLLACERAADFERAEQWCRVVTEFSHRYQAKPLFPFCHVTYGTILSATGRWSEAEEALLRAVRMFGEGHRAMRVIAAARLADLRLKQGRLEEAAQLLSGYEEHPLAVRPAVRLLLSQDRASLASRLLQERLEQVGRASLLAAPLLALLAEVQLAIGNVESAQETAEALLGLAQMSNQPSIEAEAELALGAVELRLTRPAAALPHLERATQLFGTLELPLEAARARALAAKARAAEDRELAIADLRAAVAVFDRLGARQDFDAAAAHLRELGDAGPRGPKGASTLTQREEEVLALLGAGLSNPEIARRLFISPKTAEHHVSRVLQKLELRSRAEAAAYAVRHAAAVSASN